MDMNTIERIEKLLLEAGVPPHKVRSSLSEVCDVTPQAVGEWFKGTTKRISPEYIAAIAAHWNTSSDYLITGKHPKTQSITPTDASEFFEQYGEFFDNLPLREKMRLAAKLDLLCDQELKNLQDLSD